MLILSPTLKGNKQQFGKAEIWLRENLLTLEFTENSFKERTQKTANISSYLVFVLA